METIDLQPGSLALFGYGSLISRPSLIRTLGRDYNGLFQICRLRGWKRSWDIAMPNDTFFSEDAKGRFYPKEILYLNLRREPGILANGVLFVVDQAALRAFDEREWIYERVDVTDQLENVRLMGGRAFAYIGKSEYVRTGARSPRDLAVRQTYLAILESGIASLERSFRRDYQESTDPVPSHLVINDQRK